MRIKLIAALLLVAAAGCRTAPKQPPQPMLCHEKTEGGLYERFANERGDANPKWWAEGGRCGTMMADFAGPGTWHVYVMTQEDAPDFRSKAAALAYLDDWCPLPAPKPITVTQTSTSDDCGNIVAVAGDVDVECSDSQSQPKKRGSAHATGKNAVAISGDGNSVIYQ